MLHKRKMTKKIFLQVSVYIFLSFILSSFLCVKVHAGGEKRGYSDSSGVEGEGAKRPRRDSELSVSDTQLSGLATQPLVNDDTASVVSDDEGMEAGPPEGAQSAVTADGANGNHIDQLVNDFFSDLQVSTEYPDSYNFYLFGGHKPLSDCLKGKLKEAYERGGGTGGGAFFAKGTLACGDQATGEYCVHYETSTEGPTECFFKAMMRGSSVASPPAHVPSLGLKSGMLSFKVTTRASEPFTVLIPCGSNGYHYVDDSHIKGFGFQCLLANGVLKEEFLKKVEWESVKSSNRRRDVVQMRHPSTPGELGLERLESQVKTLVCSTRLSHSGVEAGRDKVRFPIAKKDAKSGGGFSLDSTLRTLYKVSEGLANLYKEPNEERYESVLGGFRELSAGEEITRVETKLAEELGNCKNEQFLFINWDKFPRGKKVEGFTFLGKKHSYEKPFVEVVKQHLLSPGTSLAETVAVHYPKSEGGFSLRDLLLSPPIKYDDEHHVVLAYGKWIKMPSDLVERKRRFIKNRVFEPDDYLLPKFSPSTHNKKVKGKMQEDEAVYNQAAVDAMNADAKSKAFNFDRQTSFSVPVSQEARDSGRELKESKAGKERVDVEFGDILLQKNGLLYVMHIKRMGQEWSSGTLSHLQAQANVSSSIATNERRSFQDYILPKLTEEVPGAIRDKVKSGEFRIVLGIVLPRGEKAAGTDGIPYFTIHQLYDTIMTIESRGYPVHLTFIQRDGTELPSDPSSAGGDGATAGPSKGAKSGRSGKGAAGKQKGKGSC